MKELILGVDARCSHGIINEINGECAICTWERILLGRELPFKVRFIGKQGLKKDAIYSVVGIIMKGVIKEGPIPGFLLEDDDGDIFDCTFDMSLFSTRLEP